jgi:hypothetical protein
VVTRFDGDLECQDVILESSHVLQTVEDMCRKKVSPIIITASTECSRVWVANARTRLQRRGGHVSSVRVAGIDGSASE